MLERSQMSTTTTKLHGTHFISSVFWAFCTFVESLYIYSFLVLLPTACYDL